MVEADGTISVALLGAAEARPGQEPDPVLAQGPALAEKAKLLLRSALKAAMASADGNEGPADSAAPPRRIVRWRGEK
jgi:hypothetical protein